MQGEPAAAEASVTLHQHDACHVFSRGSCPWITGPWQWRAAQGPGRDVWVVTCACTQASWWLQQQPERPMPVSGVRADSRNSLLSLELL